MAEAHVSGARPAETVAVVVVTFNRADLLAGMLEGLAALERRPDAVIVVDNASTDHTREVLEAATGLPLQAIHAEENTGGAGGFHLGMRTAVEQGWDRVWLMDDDVVPAPDCLTVLMDTDADCLMAVREDTSGRLVEKAATDFDLANPLAIKPKRAMVETRYPTREAMPEQVELHNVAFEGFMVRREVVVRVGMTDPAYCSSIPRVNSTAGTASQRGSKPFSRATTRTVATMQIQTSEIGMSRFQPSAMNWS